jgi:hypothetical protein
VVTVRFGAGHGLPLSELAGGLQRSLEVSANRFRLDTAVAGESWVELLLSTLRRAAELRSDARRESVVPV